jgi:hypothetical protein
VLPRLRPLRSAAVIMEGKLGRYQSVVEVVLMGCEEEDVSAVLPELRSTPSLRSLELPASCAERAVDAEAVCGLATLTTLRFREVREEYAEDTGEPVEAVGEPSEPVPSETGCRNGNRLGFAVTSLSAPPLLEYMARAHAHSSTVIRDALLTLPPRRSVKLGWRACSGPASVHHLSLQLAVKAELLRKLTMEEVKGMQRDLVVQLWGVSGPLSKWESATAVI